MPNNTFPGWTRPQDESLENWVEGRIARFATRTFDWNALKFQADYDPNYRRAQMRYMGTGAAGVKTDTNTIAAEHFTFSTMVLPPGCEGPMHVHDDAEEVFFMLRGSITLHIEQDGETYTTQLEERDLISVPPGIYRGLVNSAAEEALMCVMLGTPKPQLPSYPDDHPLTALRKQRAAEAKSA